jgi:pilus assembly protein Flp/PilA
MIQLISLIQSRLAAAREEDRGATMVEYGILIALISVVSIALIATIGTEIQDAFQSVVDELT